MAGNWYAFWITGGIVYIITASLIFSALILWRKKSSAPPPQFGDNYPVEIMGVLLPLALVLGLFFMMTWPLENKIDHLVRKPGVNVNVTAFRWSWQFVYPAYGIRIIGTPTQEPELVLPVNETAQINLSSVDVDHAFWIPSFLFKKDAIPGLTNSFDLDPRETGRYWGECAEFCGLEHARMHFAVRVVAPDEFQRWARSHGTLALR